jgi:hypothetical protein
MLIIRLTRLTNAQHRFEYIRDDGSGESAELDTRSFLLHDLIHFAVESEARLEESFYGLLAKGLSFADLREASSFSTREELATTERVVGMMTGIAKGKAEVSELLRRSDAQIPSWFDEAFVVRAAERLRRLRGEWNALPFGKTMTLRFPFGA